MATPLIRVMNGHIYRVSNRRKRKPELKPSEIPTLLGYTANRDYFRSGYLHHRLLVMGC